MCQNHNCKEVVVSERGPKVVGPYSQAVIAGGMVYTSGQIPINPETGNIEAKDIKEQTRRVIENLKIILEDSSTELKNVIKITIFLTDINNYSEVNEVYKEYFVNDFPARTCVEVSKLPKGADVEIEAVALIED